VPVERKKGGHRCVSHALVAVDKGVPLGKCKAQRGRLLDEDAVESFPPKVALGWATADSSAPRSRIPGAPPVAASTRRCSSTTSPKAR
jgi:hypothetical protein